MKSKAVSAEFVDVIPEQLEEGILYICERYNTASHRCCCGCGEEVVTPLTPADWSVRKEGNNVSLSPSIGNWSFTCRSHYWIHQNQVIWAGAMSQKQVALVKARDKADKAAYIAAVNAQKELQSGSLFTKLWRIIVRWFQK